MVIDDEPLSIELLQSFIGKIPYLNLIAAYTEPLIALEHLQNNDVDLIFLDIKMPDITGIDFFKSLARKPELIFITAYGEYAVQGFELKALDYLVKPISFERFVTAVNFTKQHFESKKERQAHHKDYFFINVSYKIHKIHYCDILYLEGSKDYTKLYLSDIPAPLLVLHNLKHFEDLLHKNQFIRIHRSFIVPLTKISTITRKSVTIGNKEIPVSDQYRDRLFSMIE